MTGLPKTLRQLNGISDKPAKLSDSVLIIVDAQKEYTEGILPLADINKSTKALSTFLNKLRNMNIPIIHVIQIGMPGGKIMDSTGKMVEIIDDVKPVEGEYIVEKKLPSSFKGTILQEILEKLGKKDLIVAGYMTHMCLNSTVRDAAELGYRCTVVEELTTTRDLPYKNTVIPADIVKKVHLAALADRFSIVLESANELN